MFVILYTLVLSLLFQIHKLNSNGHSNGCWVYQIRGRLLEKMDLWHIHLMND